MAISYVGAGAIVYATGTTIAPAYPTGLTNQDVAVAIFGSKDDTASVTIPADWTDQGAAVLTAAASPAATGIDIGPTRVSMKTKELAGTESGSVTFTISSNVTWAQILVFRKSNTSAIWNYALASGYDAAGGVGWNVTSSGSLAVASGDVIVEGICLPTDTNPTWGTFNHSFASGTAVVGAPTVVGTAATTLQKDLGGRTQYASITSGSSTATISASSTLSGTTTNAYGPMVFLRLREVAPPTAPTAAPTLISNPEYLSATIPTFPAGVTNAYIYVNGSYAVNATSYGTYPLSGYTPDATATYSITYTWLNAAGESSPSPAANGSPAPAGPVFSLTAKNASADVVVTVRSYPAQYNIYRAPTGQTPVLVYTSPTQAASGTYTYTDTGLTNGTSYDYTVSTVVTTPTTRESNKSAIKSITPSSAVIMRPNSTVTAPATGWTFYGPGSVHGCIGDNNDSTYVEFTSTADSAVVGFAGLGSGIQPDPSANYTIYARAVGTYNAPTTSFPIQISVGGTVIRSWTVPSADTIDVTQFSASFAASELGSGDLSNLTLTISAVTPTGSVTDLYDVWLSVPTQAASSATPISASDTLSVSVTETSQVNVTTQAITASDTLSVSVTESRAFGTIPIAASDTLSVSITDTRSFGTVSVSGTDTLTASLTEASTLPPVTVTASDTLNVSITDTGAFAPIAINASDTLSTSITESRVFGTVSVTATDTLQTSITEASSAAATLTASDTLNVAVSETTAFGTIPITTSDTLSSSITESRAFGTVSVSATDTLSSSITEARSFGTVSVSATDTLSTSISETSGFGGSTAAASDTLSVSLTEQSSILVTSTPGSDSLGVSITESSSIAVSGTVAKTASDALSVSVSETTGFGTVSVTATDTLSTSIADASAFAPVTLTAQDSLNVSISDSAAFGTVSVSGTDSLNVSLADVAGFAPVAITGQDTLSVSISENTGFGTVAVSASDSLTISIGESANFAPIAVSASDTLNVAVGEARAFGWVAVESQDTLSVTVSDVSVFGAVQISATDTLNAGITDTSSLHASGTTNLVASDTLSVSVTETASIAVTIYHVHASDTLSVAITDTAGFSPVKVSGGDVLGVNVDEAAVFGTTSVSASDTLNTSITEMIKMSGQSATGTDALAVSLTEQASIVAIGTRIVTSGDLLNFAVTDTANAQVTHANITASDTLSVSIDDLYDLTETIVDFVTITATDILRISITEGSEKEFTDRKFHPEKWIKTVERVYLAGGGYIQRPTRRRI